MLICASSVSRHPNQAPSLPPPHLRSSPPAPPRPNSSSMDLPPVPRNAAFRPPSRIGQQLPALEPTPSIDLALLARVPSNPSEHAHLYNRSFVDMQTPNYDDSARLRPLQLSQAPQNPPIDVWSPTDSARSGGLAHHRSARRDTSTSLDDADDRMAAEALCGLGKVGERALVSTTSGLMLTATQKTVHIPIMQAMRHHSSTSR